MIETILILIILFQLHHSHKMKQDYENWSKRQAQRWSDYTDQLIKTIDELKEGK